MNVSKKAFTLVELIVVITILAILATIGFVSYQGYALSARESARLNDIKVIEKGLGLYATRHTTLPLPDSSVTLTASGTTVWYQGAAGTGVLATISQAQKITDPFDNQFYSYFVDANQVSFQLLAMMENSESVALGTTSQTYANGEYEDRYPKTFGKGLGILTHADNTPLYLTGGLTTLDIVNYSGSDLYTAHFSENRSVTWTGDVLWELPVNASCSRIKETTSTNNGIYTINPKWSWNIEVYCEMWIDNGGWTLIARTSTGAVGWFGWLISSWDVADNSSFYSLWDASINLWFDEIMLTTYSSEKNIDRAIKVTVDKSYVTNPINHSYKRLSSDCAEIYPLWASWRSACDGDGEDGKEWTRNFARSWWWFADSNGVPTTKFTFRNSTHWAQFSTNVSTQLVDISDPSYGGITVDWYTQWDCAIGSACSSFWDFWWRQGMIFVR